MKLFLDLDSRTFLEFQHSSRALQSIVMKRRDRVPLDLQFVQNGNVVELEDGATGQLGIKADNDFSGLFAAFSAQWTKSGTGDAALYRFELNLNTVEIDTLFAGVPKKRISLMLETEWSESTLLTSSNTLPVTLENDVVRGDEGTPVTANSTRKATSQEAEAGTDDASWMTPLKTSLAIAALAATGPQGETGLTGAPGEQGIQGLQGETGPSGSDGAQGPQGVIGPAGTDGATGPQGIQGERGEPGADGQVGIPGEQGIQGLQGEIGPSGNDGAQGPQGEVGPAGSDGATGPQGEQGIQGDTGPAGADGVDGSPGAKGDTGATGQQGPAGADGAMGPQGLPGAEGAMGAQGTAGVDGADGAVGPQGDQGLTGPTGDTGADGPIGPQGPTGADGAPGDKGDIGESGPQGSSGADGLPGVPGPQGSAGADGVAGPKGDTGTDGAAGPQGLAGADGAQGIPGESGPAGADGISGSQGEQGPQGVQGETGPAGADGDDFVSVFSETPPLNPVEGTRWVDSNSLCPYDFYNGVWVESPTASTGPQGSAGADGPQGIQGEQGPAGADGAQGPQGAAGPAGTTRWDGITDKPATFVPESHAHPISSITGLQSALDASSHTTRYETFEHFENGRTAPKWSMSSNDSGGTGLTYIVDGKQGVFRHSTGTATAANQRAGLSSNGSALHLGQGAAMRCVWNMRFAALPDAVNTGAIRLGFMDSASSESTDGAFFRLIDAGNLYAVTRSNGIETAVDCGFRPDATTWHSLGVAVNADGTSAVFSNGLSVLVTITTNIPSGPGRQTGIGNWILRTAATAFALNLDVDGLYVKITYPSALVF